jgi:menaquinone-dependent protoporphyrinogen oxidase
MRRILVAYGTTNGHTAKIAASIAATLREAGADVECVEAKSGWPQPEGYDAVIVAASVHGGKYQRAVRRWARANASALNRRPGAFISVCLGVLQREEKVQKDVRAIMARFLAAAGWQPTMTTTVAGALLYTQYNPLMRWIMKRMAASAGGDTDTSRDYVYTDWAALRAFVEDFASALRRGSPVSSVAPDHSRQRTSTPSPP